MGISDTSNLESPAARWRQTIAVVRNIRVKKLQVTFGVTGFSIVGTVNCLSFMTQTCEAQ